VRFVEDVVVVWCLDSKLGSCGHVEFKESGEAMAGSRVSLNCEPMPATTTLLLNRQKKV
jgi:hypothetical protein